MRLGSIGVARTLSPRQFEYASQSRNGRFSNGVPAFLLQDYRDLEGHFDKIASVGMFEHIGRGRLKEYFGKLFA